MTVSPVLDDVYTAVRAFILGILPLDGMHVVKGTQNRVAMPVGPFVELYIATARRLATTVDTWDPTDPDPTDITRQQSVELEMQVSIYGPLSGDMAAIFTTLWRDDYGCTALGASCQPLHCDEPMRSPLDNGEDQYEDKWTCRARLQYNPVIATAAQFADVVNIGVINATVEYAP